MTKPKTKTIIKWLVLAYLLYLLYNTPKTSWEQSEVIEEKQPSGRIMRYAHKQSSYIKYVIAWWKIKMQTIGLTGIIDQYILAPVGITFENK